MKFAGLLARTRKRTAKFVENVLRIDRETVEKHELQDIMTLTIIAHRHVRYYVVGRHLSYNTI